LERIVTSLRTPEPVGQLFRKQVTCVSEDDTLAMVVKLAFEHGFSQFPVLARERFIGLITETEITRWLGHRALNHGTELDLATVYVRAVLCEKEPNEPRVQIFCFARSDASAEEVISLFAVHPTLQVVLLTANGGSRAEIEGIVTQWDAARYPASNGLNLLEPT
jgi:predicted transcriptional regulator